MREFADRTEEAQPDVLARELARERAQHALVLRPDRPDTQFLAVVVDGSLEFDRIGLDRKPRGPFFPGGFAHHNPGIERDHALGVDQQRIDIEFGNLVDVGDELGQADHRLAHRLARGGWPVAIAAQQTIDPRAAERLLRQHRVERRQRQRLVVDHFRRDAAMAHHHDRPEDGIFGRAQDQLDGVVTPDHRLDDETVEHGAGRGRADTIGHVAHCIDHGLLRPKI